MEATAFVYYREKSRCAAGNSRNGMSVSVRLVVIVFALCVIFVVDVRAQMADTVVVATQTRGKIDFKVNLTGFDRSYHGNDYNLERVLATVDSLVLDPHMQVKGITVVGTASPEGPYDNNVRLATARARAFIDILRSRYAFPDSIYTISTIPEDWEGMRLMLEGDGTIPYAEVVLGFLDETERLDPETRERRLKRLDGGRPYFSMRDNVLPYLRRASVSVNCEARMIRPRQYKASGLVPALPATNSLLPPPCLNPLTIPVRVPAPRRRFVAVKTNLLWDAALCANLGFEVELWPHWSLDVPVWYSPYDITERWRVRLLATQPEVRWWPGVAGAGHYFGVHTTIAGFNISTCGDYRYQDPNHAAFGVGAGYGYAFHLDKDRRWGLELQIGAGYISYKWIKYHNTGRNGAEVSRSGGTYWGVTRAGITLSYKFYTDRKERRWMKW